MNNAPCTANAADPPAQDRRAQPARGRADTLPRRLVTARRSFCRHVRSVLAAQACAIQFTGDALGGRTVVGCDGLPVAEARRLGALPDGAPAGPGFAHRLSGVFPVAGGTLRIAVLRGAGAPPFSEGDRRTLEGVGGLAGSFVELVGTAAELSGLWHSSMQVLDRLAVGVVLVGSGGEVLASNRTARDIALTHTGDAEGGGPRPLLHSLSQSVRRTADAASAFARLEAAEDGRISVLATPLARAAGGGGRSQASTALFLSDAGRLFAPYQDWLCRFYGLTRLEAQLVTQLVEGRSLGEVAASLRVSIHTVRTYLKQIFGKTGVHRQADLVKLVVGGIGQVRADPDCAAPTRLTPKL